MTIKEEFDAWWNSAKNEKGTDCRQIAFLAFKAGRVSILEFQKIGGLSPSDLEKHLERVNGK